MSMAVLREGAASPSKTSLAIAAQAPYESGLIQVIAEKATPAGAESDFDDDQVVAEQGVDDLADAVVGQAAVEGFGQVGGGEVADFVPGLRRCCTQGHQQVALAGAGPTRARFSRAVIHSRVAR